MTSQSKLFFVDGSVRGLQTKTFSLDGHISYARQFTMDGFISEPLGEYRGLMTRADRDLLEVPQPNDTVHVVDEDAKTIDHQMWTGNEWLSAAQVHAPERGYKKAIIGPTTAGWYAEMGDPTHPFRYTDGIKETFWVDNSGGIHSTQVNFGASSTLDAADSITITETAPFATPLRVQKNSGGGIGLSTKSVSWPGSTVAGDLLVFIVNCDSDTATVSTPPSGYTLGPTSIGSGRASRLYYKLNCGAAEAAPSITMSTTVNIEVAIIEYSGIATSSAFDLSFNHISPTTDGYDYVNTGLTQSSQAAEVIIGVIGRPGPIGTIASAGWGTVVAESNSPGQLAGLLVGEVFATAQSNYQILSASSGYGSNNLLASFKAATIGISTPAANKLKIYAEDLGGETRLRYKTDAGNAFLLDSGGRFGGYVSGAEPNISNSNVQATLQAINLAANTAKLGDEIIIDMWGTTNNKATSGTLLFEIALGGSLLDHTVASQSGAQSGIPWHIRAVCQVVALGVSGTYRCVIEWRSLMDPTNINSQSVLWVQDASADFTGTVNLFKLDAKWQTANVNNDIFIFGCTVDYIRMGA